MEILDELFAATRMSGSISVMLLKLCLFTSLNIVRKVSSGVHSFSSIVGGSLACGIVPSSILGTSVHFMSLGQGLVSLVDNHFYGLAELLCICVIKNGPENWPFR